MGALNNLLNGFQIALSFQNIYLCFIGCLWGTMIGVLPGIGPLIGITLLIPATFSLDATGAIIMLAGIYYGAMYGGSTTSILMNIPGESASVVTCIDGHQMTLKGRGWSCPFYQRMGILDRGDAEHRRSHAFCAPVGRFSGRNSVPLRCLLFFCWPLFCSGLWGGRRFLRPSPWCVWACFLARSAWTQ